jgi:Tfp pilus assembly protein PilO
LQRSVPLDAGVSEFIDDLNNLAVASGVTVSNLTVDPAQQYVAPESAAAAAPADDPAEPADDAAAADPLAPPEVTNPLVTSANFILIPISIDTTGSYAQVVDFVSGLQNGPRLFLVNTFASASTSEEVAGEVTGSITGYIYVLLDQYDPEARAEAAEAARVEAEEAAAEIAEPATTP